VKQIDITISATIRPELLYVTLDSFKSKLLKNNFKYRVILNVDPIGDDKYNQQKMLDITKFFFDNIVYNFPKEPNFPKAVIWCWKQVESDYVFHLEDDWFLIKNINLNSMINILNNNSDIASLRLSKTDQKETGKKIKDFVYHEKLSLNPTLFNGKFIKEVVKMMDDKLNPEKQLRCSNLNKRTRFICKWKHVIYTKEGNGILIKDIGREWMETTKYHKQIAFINWEEKKL